MRADLDLCKDIAEIVAEAPVFYQPAERSNLLPVGRLPGYDVYRVDLRMLGAQELKKMIAVVARVDTPFGNYPKILIGGAFFSQTGSRSLQSALPAKHEYRQTIV